MQPKRRRQLIDATIACIDADGYSGTTVAKICGRAGVSAGLAHHYFRNKDELLYAALLDLLKELRQVGILRLRQAKTPLERAGAIIDANFDEEFFTKPKVAAWLSFWAEVNRSSQLQRLQQINGRRMRSNLHDAIKQLLPGKQAGDVVTGLCALIDGLWLQWAVNDGKFDSALAKRLCHDYLDKQIAASG